MAKEYRVGAEALVNLSRAEMWQRMKDLTKAHYYVPGLIDCRMTTEKKEGVGASRKVYMKGMVMDETVVEWTEGQGFVIRLHNGDGPPMMFAQARFYYSMEDGPNGQTWFKPAITYTLKGGLLGNIFSPLMKRMMVKNLKGVAEGLKKYYETGQPSNKAFTKA